MGSRTRSRSAGSAAMRERVGAVFSARQQRPVRNQWPGRRCTTRAVRPRPSSAVWPRSPHPSNMTHTRCIWPFGDRQIRGNTLPNGPPCHRHRHDADHANAPLMQPGAARDRVSLRQPPAAERGSAHNATSSMPRSPAKGSPASAATGENGELSYLNRSVARTMGCLWVRGARPDHGQGEPAAPHLLWREERRSSKFRRGVCQNLRTVAPSAAHQPAV
jgi:hypothetical protein